MWGGGDPSPNQRYETIVPYFAYPHKVRLPLVGQSLTVVVDRRRTASDAIAGPVPCRHATRALLIARDTWKASSTGLSGSSMLYSKIVFRPFAVSTRTMAAEAVVMRPMHGYGCPRGREGTRYTAGRIRCRGRRGRQGGGEGALFIQRRWVGCLGARGLALTAAVYHVDGDGVLLRRRRAPVGLHLGELDVHRLVLHRSLIRSRATRR